MVRSSLLRLVLVASLVLLVIASGSLAFAQPVGQPSGQPVAKSAAAPTFDAANPPKIADLIPSDEQSEDKKAPNTPPTDAIPYAPHDQALQGEVEPNGTAATATALGSHRYRHLGQYLPQCRHRLLLLYGQRRRSRLRRDDDLLFGFLA